MSYLDLANNILSTQLYTPQSNTQSGTTVNTAELDLQGKDGAMIIVVVGEHGGTTSGSLKHHFVLQHSDASGSGFTDVTSAIAALDFAGVCGPVVFNIRTGVYTDQFDLGQIVGMDATNTVTFKSETGDRDDVTFNYASTSLANNYVVKMNGADYFRFESMTLRNTGASFGTVVTISGGSDHNTF